MKILKGFNLFLVILLLSACSGERAVELEKLLDNSPVVSDYGDPVADIKILHRSDISHGIRSRAVAWITADVATIDNAVATAVSAALDIQQGTGFDAISVDFYQLKSNGDRAIIPMVTAEYSPDGAGFNGTDESGEVIIKVTAPSELPTQEQIDLDLIAGFKHQIIRPQKAR